MRSRLQLSTALAAIALVGLVSIAVAQSPAASPLPPSPAEFGMPLHLTFSGTSEPSQNHLHEVGPDGSTDYGTVRQTGTTDIAGTVVEVEVVGTSFYRHGTGSFTGALTLRYPSGDELGFRYDAVVIANAEGTRIVGSLTVLGGSGALRDVTGGGSIVGTRTGPIGSPVEHRLTLDLSGLPHPEDVGSAGSTPTISGQVPSAPHRTRPTGA